MITTFEAELVNSNGVTLRGNMSKLPRFDDGLSSSVMNNEEFDFYIYDGQPPLQAGESVVYKGLTLEVVWIETGIPNFERVRLKKRWTT